MNKNIVIVTVVIVAGFITWLIYNKKKTGSFKPSFLQNNGTLAIPQKVQDNLDAFSEGEKFKFEGRTYQVVNGSWQIA